MYYAEEKRTIKKILGGNVKTQNVKTERGIMVHTNCKRKEGRGRPSTEFYRNGKPQIYCRGFYDMMTDEPLEVCRNCLDWVDGEQVEKDFEDAKAKGELG